jgi:ABC-type phosphate transport system permease subunit
MKKLFKIIGSIILILIIAVVVFLYFVSTPLPEGQQGAKAEALTDKFKQPSIKQLGILPFFFSFRGNHHYL